MKKKLLYVPLIALVLLSGKLIYDFTFSDFELDVTLTKISLEPISDELNAVGLNYSVDTLLLTEVYVVEVEVENTGLRDIKQGDFDLSNPFHFILDSTVNVIGLHNPTKNAFKIDDYQILMDPGTLRVGEIKKFTLFSTTPIGSLTDGGTIFDLRDIDYLLWDEDKNPYARKSIGTPIIFSILIALTIMFLGTYAAANRWMAQTPTYPPGGFPDNYYNYRPNTKYYRIFNISAGALYLAWFIYGFMFRQLSLMPVVVGTGSFVLLIFAIGSLTSIPIEEKSTEWYENNPWTKEHDNSRSGDS